MARRELTTYDYDAGYVLHLTAITLVMTSLCGCGGSRQPVEGVVTLDGKPLKSATVALHRTDGPDHDRVYLGETDDQGRYRLKTADGSATGAPAGSYRVFISTVKVPPEANETTKLPPERVPANWRDGSEQFEVPSGGTSEANFSITTLRRRN